MGELRHMPNPTLALTLTLTLTTNPNPNPNQVGELRHMPTAEGNWEVHHLSASGDWVLGLGSRVGR